MNWLAQIFHVTVKDLRSMKWPLGLYLVMMAVATVIALGWPRLGASGVELVSIVLIPMAMGLGAMLVHGDAPSRVDDFWATRPLHWYAIALAKVVVATIAILLPGLIAQAIALMSFELPARELLQQLAMAGVVFGGVVILGMAVAVFTPDLKSWLVVTVVGVIALVVASSVIGPPNPPIKLPSSFGYLLTSVTFGLLLVAVIYIYKTRNVRHGRALAVGFLLLSFVEPHAIGTKPPSPKPLGPGSPATVTDARIDTRQHPAMLTVHFASSLAAPGDLFSGVGPPAGLMVVYPDGRVDTLQSQDGAFSADMNQPALELPSDITWLNALGWEDDHPRVGAQVTAGQVDALIKGGASLRVAGEIALRHQLPSLSMPIAPGSTARIARAHYEVDAAWMAGSPRVALRSSTLGASSFGIWVWMMGGQALVNVGRHQAIHMRQGNHSSGGGSTLPLPGSDERNQWIELTGEFTHEEMPVVVDKDWVRNAELRIVRWSEPITLRVDTMVTVHASSDSTQRPFKGATLRIPGSTGVSVQLRRP